MNESKLYTSFKVVLEMLSDRGVDTSEISEQYTPQMLTEVVTTQSSTGIPCGTIRIFYFNHSQVKNHIKKYDFSGNSENIDLHLIVMSEPLGHASLKSLQEVYKKHSSIKWQIFNLEEVLINISKHVLVPKHILVPKENEASLLNNLMCTKSQLPVILKTDPMARYLGLEHGQIVQIVSFSPTAGEYISYRTCV